MRELLAQYPRQTFTQIYRALQQRGCPRPEIGWLNLDRSSREELIGNKTDAAMARLGLAEDWAELEPGQRITVINLLADIGSPETLCTPGWHDQLVVGGKQPRKRVLAAPVIAFIDKLAAQPGFGRLGAMGLDAGRSAYSVKALGRLADAMCDHGIDEHAAVARLYPAPETNRQATARELGRPRATGNTVVDVALRQVRYTVNAAIRHLGGPPTQTRRRFYKGDSVCDSKDGLLFVVGQIKAENNGSLILARNVETATPDQLKGTPGYRKVSGGQIARLEVLPDVCSSHPVD